MKKYSISMVYVATMLFLCSSINATDWFREGEFLVDTGFVYIPSRHGSGASIAFDGTNYLVIWQDGRSWVDIYGTRVSQEGVVLDPIGIAISTDAAAERAPSVTFGGDNYFAVWEDNRAGCRIYGARLSQTGEVLDPDGIAISTPGQQGSPSVAFDGTNYLVVWHWNSDGSWNIYGARVSQTGTLLDTIPIVISNAPNGQHSSSVIFDGTNYMVVWQDFRSGLYSEIYGARVDQSGNVLDTAGIVISTAADDLYSPVVGFDGSNYLVTWTKYDEVRGARVNQEGTVLDPDGITISADYSMVYHVNVAFDGTNYLVAWHHWTSYGIYIFYDVHAVRVSQTGIVLDSPAIAIATGPYDQRGPSTAFDGSNYLVVWDDERNAHDMCDIYGTRINQEGNVLDSTGIVISLAANEQHTPAVAFDGTNYLVVWEEDRSRSYDIYGARVSQGGVGLDPGGIPISTADWYQYTPCVAFDGTNYFVVWRDDRDDGAHDIYGARVSQTGIVLDTAGIPICLAVGEQESPSVTFDGTNYLVVWHDSRNGNYTDDIYGKRVSPGGVVLDPVGIVISAASSYQKHPSIAFDGTNYFVVWADHRYGNMDIRGSRVTQSGEVLDPSGRVISADPLPCNEEYPAVAFDGTNYLVVWHWEDVINDISEIQGARVSQSGVVLDTGGFVISTADTNRRLVPAVAFDGENYLVVWHGDRSDSSCDIYGAWVDQSGIVVEELAVALQRGAQLDPALTHGPGHQLIVTYSGFADSINNRPTDAMRIWGKFCSSVDIEEDPEYGMSDMRCNLTVFPNPFTHTIQIRHAIHEPECIIEHLHIEVYDATGRPVYELHIAPETLDNIVSWDGCDSENRMLPSGVYFLKLQAGDYSAIKKLLLIK